MKCVVNWIPLRIRVRSRNTQTHLKRVESGPKICPATGVRLEMVIGMKNEILIGIMKVLFQVSFHLKI